MDWKKYYRDFTRRCDVQLTDNPCKVCDRGLDASKQFAKKFLFVASILCNGDIYSCMDIERRPEMVQGNIMTDHFVDIWENRFQRFRQDRTNNCEMCRQCTDRKYCRGDSAHTWDYDNNQPLFCVKQFLSAKGG